MVQQLGHDEDAVLGMDDDKLQQSRKTGSKHRQQTGSESNVGTLLSGDVAAAQSDEHVVIIICWQSLL